MCGKKDLLESRCSTCTAGDEVPYDMIAGTTSGQWVLDKARKRRGGRVRGCVYAVLHPAFFSRDQQRQDENPASTLAFSCIVPRCLERLPAPQYLFGCWSTSTVCAGTVLVQYHNLHATPL